MTEEDLERLENKIKEINEKYENIISEVSNIAWQLGSEYSKAKYVEKDEELAKKLIELINKMV